MTRIDLAHGGALEIHSGSIQTPKADIDLIRARLKMAEDIAMG